MGWGMDGDTNSRDRTNNSDINFNYTCTTPASQRFAGVGIFEDPSALMEKKMSMRIRRETHNRTRAI